MNKINLIQKIENFAPPETQETWDCSGWAVESSTNNITKVLLTLNVTKDTFNQAKRSGCDLIISHHPLFFIPFDFKSIPIYVAHTNLDKANGGTTDTLLEFLGLCATQKFEFTRVVELQEPISVENFANKLKTISPNARLVNNQNKTLIKTIGFCAGSGFDCIDEVKNIDLDCFVSGDLKYHKALESQIVLFDIGHFESERPVLDTIKNIIGQEIEVIKSNETSPFKTI